MLEQMCYEEAVKLSRGQKDKIYLVPSKTTMAVSQGKAKTPDKLGECFYPSVCFQFLPLEGKTQKK